MSRAWSPGHVVASKYALVGLLGRGGMGEVWRARHLELGSMVALKSLDRRLANSDVGRARFLREAKAAAALRSPHVIQIHDYGVDDGTPYIAMELLEGTSLDARLAEGPLSSAEAMRVIDHVARAIGKAHEVGFVHRDLKPANIFLCPNEAEADPLLRRFWAVKVLDFGVAKEVESADGIEATGREGRDVPSTETGAVLGTPHYMSPEQARGKAVDARTDLWALGVIAYECLVGVRPFRGASFGELVLAICSDPPPIPSAHATVPAGFDAWFARAVARDPRDRFGSTRELSEALRGVLEPAATSSESPSSGSREPSQPSPESTTRPAPTTSVSARRWLVPVVLATMVTAALAGFALQRRPDPSLESAATSAASAEQPQSAAATSGSAVVRPQARNVKSRPITFDGTALWPSLSSDGRTVYFAKREGPGKIVIARLGDNGGATELLRLGGIASLAAAPDGQSALVVGAADRHAPSEWQIVDAEGHVRAHGAGGRFSPSWAPDGQRFACFLNSAGKEITIQSLDGSSRNVVVTGNYQWLAGTHWLKGHDRILVEVQGPEQKQRVLMLRPDGGPATELPVPISQWQAMAATDDALFFVTMPTPTADVLRFTLDPAEATVSPQGETLAAGTDASTITASRDGAIVVFGTSHERSSLQLSTTADGAAWQPITRSAQLNQVPRFSPDGSKVAFVRITDQRGLALLPSDDAQAEPTTLSGPDEEIMGFAWGPDGTELAALVLRKDKTATIMRYAVTGGPPREIATGLSLAVAEDTLAWAPSPKIYVRVSGNQNYAMVDPNTGASSMLLHNLEGWVFEARGNGDGKSVFYRHSSVKERPDGAWLIPSAGTQPTLLTEATAYPVAFSQDGRALYLKVLPRRGPPRLERVRFDGKKPELVRDLDFGSDEVAGLDVAPDGTRVVVSRRHPERDLVRVELGP